MIPKDFIEELLKHVNIVDLIRGEIPLSKQGKNYAGICPFHQARPGNELSKSFTVSVPKNFYHCFYCRAHGSPIQFLMAYSKLSFVEAISVLAERSGFRAFVDSRDAQETDRTVRRDATSALEVITAHYERHLRSSPEAIAFFRSHGINGHTAKRYRVGYASDDWHGLEPILGASYKTTGVDSGAVITRDDKTYDKFRHRVTYPQINATGQVFGFIAQALPKNGKTANPELLRCSIKKNTQSIPDIFGWHQAIRNIAQTEATILVQNCLDVMFLSQNGISNVLAPAYSRGRIRPKYVEAIFKRSKVLYCCFSSSEEGFNEAWLTLKDSLPFINGEHQIRFIFIPNATGSLSFVNEEHGTAKFKQMMAASTTLTDYLFRNLVRRFDLDSIEGRSHARNKYDELITAVADEPFRLMLIDASEDWFKGGVEVISNFEAHDRVMMEVLTSAQQRIVIVTPWITARGIRRFDLCALIKAAVDRHVNVAIYTDAQLTNEFDSKVSGAIENLITAGASVNFLSKIHSKWILRDQDLITIGSFNWLSAANTGPYMRHEVSIVHRGSDVTIHSKKLLEELTEHKFDSKEAQHKTTMSNIYLS